MNTLNNLLGATLVSLLLSPAIVVAHDNVYSNFGYGNGYPSAGHYAAPRVHSNRALPVYHTPARFYSYQSARARSDRCGRQSYSDNDYRPHRRYHQWRRPSHGYHAPAYHGYAPSNRILVEIND